ncbi:putative membrane-associated kinase regulator 1 [Cinnamomum micranthum f. kanehirae]|uniref:Putative membrane-associated kinase regulator 1 n=1 Tax=Cinnamomum micranthum f. kanehirae TaxID=337451 RepID=A0A443PSJ9_9MAGN|nr:putative membrane-associated kinase regulator 1 [Cinnamomum micranthum f. kanehirae]
MKKDPNTRRTTILSSSPPSPTSSSSSSDFEFIISLSPTSKKSSSHLCPADELFYKGQLLPLHLSPRLTMVRTLLASSSSSSDTATASRDSTASSNSSYDLSLDSARPSSATDDDDFKKPTFHSSNKKSKYFSFSKLSSVFLRKDPRTPLESSSSSSKKITSSAKEVIRKYVKKVKPLYEKFTPKQSKMAASSSSDRPLMVRNSPVDCNAPIRRYGKRENCSHSFSGNLRYPKMRSCTVSCPSSMRSSPTHSGVLRGGRGVYASSSSMEELQSAIEGAITHCKRSMNEFNEKKVGLVEALVDG